MKDTRNRRRSTKRSNRRSTKRNKRSTKRINRRSTKRKRSTKRSNRRSTKRSNRRSTKRNNRKQRGGSKKGYPEIDPGEADPERIRALIPDINTNPVVYAEPVTYSGLVANAPPAHLLTQSTPQGAVLQRQPTVPLLLDQVYPLQDIQDERYWDKIELEGCIRGCIYNQ
tara:strand:+ start:10260 stop:10766 length:507 start_codon:yes stop_codon:yes gene_type:complete